MIKLLESSGLFNLFQKAPENRSVYRPVVGGGCATPEPIEVFLAVGAGMDRRPSKTRWPYQVNSVTDREWRLDSSLLPLCSQIISPCEEQLGHVRVCGTR